MPANAGTVVVEVVGDLTKLKGELAATVGKGGMFGGVNAGVAGIGIAAVGAIAGLGQLGASFDDSYDKIRVATGATGDALKGLQDDFKATAATGPDAFDLVGTAISDLNAKLGLTGQPLQDLSRQILDLSRITDTDLSTNIESLTRFLGDAGVASTEYSSAIDSVFRASQATGQSVTSLADGLVKYGAPLRNFGFSFEQSAALLGKFQQEGVNTELVMGSLRIALGKFAKAGEDPIKGLAEVTDKIKNAGTAAEANALAFETFGARAGADMADAIRGGRFEIGALFDQVSGGTDSISKASDETADWKEKLGELGNKAKVALEPAALTVFDSFGTIIEALTPTLTTAAELVSKFATAFAALPGPIQAAIFVGAVLLVAITVLAPAFVALSGAVGGLGTAFTFLAANPIVLIITAIIVVIGLLAYVIYKNWDEIKVWLSTTWESIKQTASDVWQKIQDAVAAVGDYITNTVLPKWNEFTTALGMTWDALKTKATEVWDGIKQTIIDAATGVSTWINDKIVSPVQTVIDIFTNLPATARTAWDGLKNAIRDAVNSAKEDLESLRKKIDSALGPLDELVGKAAGGLGRLLGFDTGGVVPGPRGAPRIILAHGGETVLPTHKGPVNAGAAGGGPVTVNLSINLSNATIRNEQDIVTMSRMLADETRQALAATGQKVNGR
jgi:TP901 family phage tail tape measure protein